MHALMNRLPSLNSSATFHEQLLDAVDQAVIATDLDGRIVYWNRAAEKLYGWAANEVTGRQVLDITPAECTQNQVEDVMKTLKSGLGWTGEFLMRRRDGSSFTAVVTAAPIFDEEENTIGIVGTSSDVSIARATEVAFAARSAALRKSEWLYRTIVDTAQEGVWLLDAEARTTFVNGSIANMLGYSADEMAGRVFLDFVADEDRAEGEARFSRRRQGIKESYDIRFRRRDGSIMWALISGSPFYDEEGCFAGSLGMLTDITERKTYERGLIESKERAEELARLKSTLLTNMSHEIRTPLTGILGFAEIIATHGSDRAPEYAEIISESGRRLMDTLNAVLELAQLESRSVVLTPERLDVVNVMREVLDSFKREACRKGLYLRLEHDPAYILSTSDRSALSRLFANLTNNALKFTDHGGVTIRLAHSDRSLTVEFEDTGIGISEPFISQLFEDFKQESEGMTRNYEGVGIGLSIAKRLVDLLGGTIDVASTRGVGTTFTLQLPIALPNDPPTERNSALHQRLSSVDPYGRARDVA